MAVAVGQVHLRHKGVDVLEALALQRQDGVLDDILVGARKVVPVGNHPVNQRFVLCSPVVVVCVVVYIVTVIVICHHNGPRVGVVVEYRV